MAFDPLARVLIRFQHLLFYVVMAFARFNLYVLSYNFLLKRRHDGAQARGGKWVSWAELVAICCFWTWYLKVTRGCGDVQNQLAFFAVSNIVPSPLHVQVSFHFELLRSFAIDIFQIVLSHFSRSALDLGPKESFVQRQLRTTTDVICPEYLEFLHGGLHLQVTHHLFPRLPRHNLKRASRLVKEFAARENLEYAEFGFVEGNAQVRSVLRDVAKQVSILGNVAKGIAEQALS